MCGVAQWRSGLVTRPLLIPPPSFFSSSPTLTSVMAGVPPRRDRWLQGQEAANDVSVSRVASLPQSFGSIFLGETFTSYVIAHNGSKEAVQNVQVKVGNPLAFPLYASAAPLPPIVKSCLVTFLCHLLRQTSL